mgnify:CR=1 FL=1
MNTEDVLNEFRDAGALREGHFVLSSGLHSPVFLQKNLVFMDGARCERLCKALAEKVVAARHDLPRDLAVEPARSVGQTQQGTARVLLAAAETLLARSS